MKSEKLLKSFTKYCESHKEERFWQAITNWSGANIIGYGINLRGKLPTLFKDTFYFEHKTK